jgi:hypothetical protein
MTMPNDTSAAVPRGPDGPESRESSTGGAREQIREVKDQVVDQAKTSLRQARDSASSSLSDSRQQAANRIAGLASAVRNTSDHLRSENQAGVANLTDSLAQQVDRLANYLRDRDLGAFRDDVENFARRQPALAVGMALGLGMLAARFFKSSERSGAPSRGARSFREAHDAYEGSYDSEVYAGGGYGGA